MARRALRIQDLLNEQGTDKARWYGGLYGVLLRPIRHSVTCVVEVGIGTIIPGLPSSMAGWGSAHYRPGGSLRAWREFFAGAIIHGLDVAPDTQLHGEERIITHQCDSTDAAQVSSVIEKMKPLMPDLIIDDGFHHRSAQISTFRNLYPILRDEGLYIIEDVDSSDVLDIISVIEKMDPGADAFVDKPWGECVAIVIRK